MILPLHAARHAKREASERHDVEPDHLLQHRLVHVGRRTEGTEARVVDEDLRHDLPIREPARDLVDRTRRRQVEREQVGFGPQVAAQHFKSAHVAGDEKKPVALLGCELRELPADAARGACDDGERLNVVWHRSDSLECMDAASVQRLAPQRPPLRGGKTPTRDSPIRQTT